MRINKLFCAGLALMVLLAGCSIHTKTEEKLKDFLNRVGVSSELLYDLKNGYVIEGKDYLTGYNTKYEEGKLDILFELNIISEEDLNKDTYITTLEALEILHKASAYDDIDLEKASNISEWYRGDTLESKDYFEDRIKHLLTDMLSCERNQIITYDDVLNMELDKNITNYEVITYVTRMLNDTYGCVRFALISDVPDENEVYETAYKKGIINNTDTEYADMPILRKEFYEIIHKSIFVEYDIGSLAQTRGRLIDAIIAKNKMSEQPHETVIVNTHEISVEATISDNMSISWTLPAQYNHFVSEGFWMNISTATDDGILENRITRSSYNRISTEQIIQFIADAYPKKMDYIRCSYYVFDYDTQTRNEWFFVIDTSKIAIIIEEETIEPGIYAPFEGQWIPQSISLADGQMFKENAYYLLTSCDHKYRNPRYNRVSYAIFKTSETSYTFDNSIERSHLGVGGIYLDEIRIQEVIIEGDVASGFTLHITPLSTEAFQIRKENEQI